MAYPNFQAVGAQVASTGTTVSAVWPAHAANDIGLLVVETSGNSATMATPSGWTPVTGSPLVDVATVAGSKFHLFWKRAATSAEASVVTGALTDHIVARIYTFRGAVTSGTPFEATNTQIKTTASTTGTAPAVTTLGNERLIIRAISRANDLASTTSFGVFTGGNTINNAESGEGGTANGNGGGFKVGTGQLPNAGDSGAATCTMPSSTHTAFTLALVPAVLTPPIFTNFSEYTSGAQPSDWTQRWTTTDVSNIVTDDGAGGKFLRNTITGTGWERLISWNDADSTLYNNIEVLTKTRTSDIPNYQSSIYIKGANIASQQTSYQVQFHNQTLNMSKYVGNQFTALHAPAFGYASSTWYWIRFRHVGGVLQAKAWADSVAEPAGWTAGAGSGWVITNAVTDNTIPNAGWNGVGGYNVNGVRDYEYIAMAHGGQTAPMPSVAPTATTEAATNIAQTTVTANGTITSTGSATVTRRGFVYMSGVGTPTTANNADYLTGTYTTGAYSLNLTGLTANTTYSIRSYIMSSAGTAYGNTVQVTTAAAGTAPTVTTQAATSVAQTSFTGNGNITSVGSAQATARGMVYMAGNGTPTLANSVATTSGLFTAGAFTQAVTGLTANTLYSVRAYATNSAGTSYGSVVTVTTLAAATAPTVTSSAATYPTDIHARLTGTVSSDNGATITSRGFAVAQLANPSIPQGQITLTGTTGTFTADLEVNLDFGPDITYYYRPYATNSAGTSYGANQSFIVTTPTLTTQAATNVASTSFTANGNVTSSGNGSVTERGFVLALQAQADPDTTTNLQKVIVAGTTGAFTGNFTGLTANASYKYRPYATTAVGTSYGAAQNVTTLAASNPKAHTFTADFTSNALPANMTDGTGGTATYANGKATIPGTTTSTWRTLHSTGRYDLVASHFFAEITPGNMAQVSRQTFLYAEIDQNNKLFWLLGDNTITAKYSIGGVETNVGNTAYNAAIHKWFRIREASGTVYWDYSTDGITWTNLYSVATPITITALQLGVMLGNYATEATTTSATFDNLNVTPAAATRRKKIYIGGVWTAKPVKVYISGAWVEKPVKRFSGSTWA